MSELADKIEREHYSRFSDLIHRECEVCGLLDARVVILSSGFAVHPACWPNVKIEHVKSVRAFGRRPTLGRPFHA